MYRQAFDFASIIHFSAFSFQYSFRKPCREELKNEDLKLKNEEYKTKIPPICVDRIFALVDLSQLYSNPFLQIRSFKQRIDPQISAHSSEPLTSEDKLEAIENISPKRLNVYGETEVCRIRQKQKVLSDIEIQTVCKRYRSGDSVYKLAKDFECHRSTISAVLKRNGVEVTHLASKKPELVKKVIELYAERKDSIF